MLVKELKANSWILPLKAYLQGKVISTSMERTDFFFLNLAILLYRAYMDMYAEVLAEIQLYNILLGNEICQHNLVLLSPYWVPGISTFTFKCLQVMWLSCSYLLEKLSISPFWYEHSQNRGSQLIPDGLGLVSSVSSGSPTSWKPVGKPGQMVTPRWPLLAWKLLQPMSFIVVKGKCRAMA